MVILLRSSLLLLAISPALLCAQVSAGDATGLLHTVVGVALDPIYGPPPMSSEDTASIDADADGANEIQFTSGNIHVIDANGSYNQAMMLHAGVEVALEAPGGWVAKRLNAWDPIDATLNWQAFDAGGANTVALASLLTNFGGQWVTTGGAEWLVNGSVATYGYMAVRLVDGGGTRYGWVSLISYVSQDSAWLQINDMAIELGSNMVGSTDPLDGMAVIVQPDGRLLLQGPVSEVERIALYDGSGRCLGELNGGSAAWGLDLSNAPRGIYAVSVIARSRTRTFQLVW